MRGDFPGSPAGNGGGPQKGNVQKVTFQSL